MKKLSNILKNKIHKNGDKNGKNWRFLGKKSGFDASKHATNTKTKKLSPSNWLLVACVLILVCFGILMVYSASNYNAKLNYGNEYFYMNKQIVGAIIGLVAMTVCFFVDYHKYKKWKNIILIVSLVLLALVFVPGIGVSNNGATRWLQLPGFTIQPSEIAKFAFVIFAGAYLSQNYDVIKRFWGILPVLAVGGIMCVLIMLEPNMSITMCVGITMLVLLFVGGVQFKHFAMMSVPIGALVPLLIVIEPYRLKRLLAFANPWENPKGEGYQLLQSLYSIGEGGIFGVGLFNSRQKYMFLPFSESDFIFSIICEELGLLGATVVIALFLTIITCGIRIAKRAKDRFGSLLASGITAIIASQVLINIAVVSGSIPPTGVPLPFVSAGSTSLVVFMASIGVLMNIDKQSRRCVIQ